MQKKKILITGIAGFVGFHFLEYLLKNDTEVQVWGIDINKPRFDCSEYEKKLDLCVLQVNMLEREKLINVIRVTQPDYILHLASYSSVAYSWKYPVESFKNNTNIFLNLITTVLEECPQCRILSVGSSEEYGIVKPEQLPLKESESLKPESPYAVARVSQEMLSRIFAKNYNAKVILTRSFNHIGPYQDNRFVVPSFIERIMKLKKGNKSEGVINTGDLSIIRDFVDVRDVVDAYYKLMLYGNVGEIYNVCSGKGITLEEIMNLIARELDIQVYAKVDKELIRPNDNPVIIGDPSKLKKELNWKNTICIEKTIRDMIERGG